MENAPAAEQPGRFFLMDSCWVSRKTHRYGAGPDGYEDPVGAGLPAKQTLRGMAPASPVFAGKPAPTGTPPNLSMAVNP